MTDYGDNTTVQNLVWGTTSTDYDAKSSSARTVASDIIDSRMNNRNRITTPSSRINSAANLIASAILASNPENMSQHQWYKMAIKLIDDIKGSISDDAEWNYQVPVQKQSSFPIAPNNNQTWNDDEN